MKGGVTRTEPWGTPSVQSFPFQPAAESFDPPGKQRKTCFYVSAALSAQPAHPLFLKVFLTIFL